MFEEKFLQHLQVYIAFLQSASRKIFNIIGVMDIGLYSSGNWVGVLPFGIGVTLSIFHDSSKLLEVKRARKNLANLGKILILIVQKYL